MDILKKICEAITKHKARRCTGESVGISPTEYHYECLICKEVFWNYKPPKKKRW